MTEAEWLACTDPQPMLESLRGRANGRKRRLFACGCCRLVWRRLPSAAWRRAVQVAERYADGAATNAERSAAVAEAERGQGFPATATAWAYACYADASHGNAAGAARYGELLDPSARPQQASLLRDLFGPLPFRQVRIDPAWLAWNDGLVVRLARAAYEERERPPGNLDNARLAVLADALEDAGCDSADILDHLRSQGPHVRGCWVVDLLLGRQ